MIKKRRDEGFALAYVVVVIFVLCSISIALMSHTLRALQSQDAMTQRMQEKYALQGEIERMVGELEHALHTTDFTGSGKANDAKLAFSDFLASLGLITVAPSEQEELENYRDVPADSAQTKYSRSIDLSVERDSLRASATYEIIFSVRTSRTGTFPVTFHYTLTVEDTQFTHYEIRSGGDGL